MDYGLTSESDEVATITTASPVWELFDLAQDPRELHNCAQDHPEVGQCSQLACLEKCARTVFVIHT